MARVENAVLPVNCVGSLRKVRNAETKLCTSAVVAVSDGAAVGRRIAAAKQVGGRGGI